MPSDLKVPVPASSWKSQKTQSHASAAESGAESPQPLRYESPALTRTFPCPILVMGTFLNSCLLGRAWC